MTSFKQTLDQEMLNVHSLSGSHLYSSISFSVREVKSILHKVAVLFPETMFQFLSLIFQRLAFNVSV